MVHVLADEVESQLMPDLAKMSNAAGLITICSVSSNETGDEAGNRERARSVVGSDAFVEFDPSALSSSDDRAVGQITAELEARGFIREDDRGLNGEGI